jgi:hypothetical protein
MLISQQKTEYREQLNILYSISSVLEVEPGKAVLVNAISLIHMIFHS